MGAAACSPVTARVRVARRAGARLSPGDDTLAVSCCGAVSMGLSSIGIRVNRPLIHLMYSASGVGMMGADRGAVWRRRQKSPSGSLEPQARFPANDVAGGLSSSHRMEIFASLDGLGVAPVTTLRLSLTLLAYMARIRRKLGAPTGPHGDDKARPCYTGVAIVGIREG